MGLLDRMPAKQTRPRWTPARLWVVSAVVCVVVAGAAVGVQIGGSHCGGAVVLPAIADEDRYLDNSAAADLTSAGPADVAGHSRKRTSSPDLLVSPDAPMPATGHLVPCAMADVKRLFVDGREILVRDSGVPLVLVPGEHRVRALLTDGGICEQVITLLPYEVRRLVVSSCNGGTGR